MCWFVREWLVVLLAAILTLSGCAGVQRGAKTDDHTSPEACMAAYTGGGSLASAAAGALMFLVFDVSAAGVAAGGGAVGGAAMGYAYAWGKCFDHYSTVESQPAIDYQETVRAVSYTPTQGTDLKINNYTAQPSAVAPGGSLTFIADYYVLTPVEKDVSVTETRILRVFDKTKNRFEEAGRVPEQITVAPGLRTANGSITIPPDVEEGDYIIDFMVTAEGRTDTASIPLKITKDKAVLASAEVISVGESIRRTE